MARCRVEKEQARRWSMTTGQLVMPRFRAIGQPHFFFLIIIILAILFIIRNTMTLTLLVLGPIPPNKKEGNRRAIMGVEKVFVPDLIRLQFCDPPSLVVSRSCAENEHTAQINFLQILRTEKGLLWSSCLRRIFLCSSYACVPCPVALKLHLVQSLKT